jgi:hypothetical protein
MIKDYYELVLSRENYEIKFIEFMFYQFLIILSNAIYFLINI